jgi:hypothetical protein
MCVCLIGAFLCHFVLADFVSNAHTWLSSVTVCSPFLRAVCSKQLFPSRPDGSTYDQTHRIKEIGTYYCSNLFHMLNSASFFLNQPKLSVDRSLDIFVFQWFSFPKWPNVASCGNIRDGTESLDNRSRARFLMSTAKHQWVLFGGATSLWFLYWRLRRS